MFCLGQSMPGRLFAPCTCLWFHSLVQLLLTPQVTWYIDFTVIWMKLIKKSGNIYFWSLTFPMSIAWWGGCLIAGDKKNTTARLRLETSDCCDTRNMQNFQRTEKQMSLFSRFDRFCAVNLSYDVLYILIRFLELFNKLRTPVLWYWNHFLLS